MCDRSSDPSTYSEPEPDDYIGGWGEVWGAPMVLPGGAYVVMRRKAQRVRFAEVATGRQIGPEHKNIVPAMIWAHAQGWDDPTAPAWLNAGVKREIEANSKRRGAHL